jgi:hypothetical protein
MMQTASIFKKALGCGFGFVPSILLALLAIQTLSPTLLADDDSRRQWETQKNLSENWFRSMPVLGDRRIEDLFHLRLEGNFLSFSSAAATPGERQMRVTVEGIPGTGYLVVHRNPVSGELLRFDLNIMDFPAPMRVTNLQVGCDIDKGQLTLTNTMQFEDHTDQTMFIQEHGDNAGTTGLIQLAVSSSGRDASRSQQINLAAADVPSLLHDHPQEANLYFRPLLRRIGQEFLFAPDALTAWQIFSDTRSPDFAIARSVNEILPRLNNTEYRARRAALADLRKLGQPAADVVDRLERASLSPQQNASLDLFLSQYKRIPETEAARLRIDPTFLLDCLYSEDVQVRKSALDRLRTMFRPDLEFDIDAPSDVRMLAVANLKKQLTPAH